MDDLSSTAYEGAFAGLAGVYLEDSWVLEVTVQDQGCPFDLDAVLTPEHPRYRDPRPGEQYCYERARLTLTSGSAVEFQPSASPPATDATGSMTGATSTRSSWSIRRAVRRGLSTVVGARCWSRSRP